LITFFGIPIAAIWLKEKLTLLAIIGGVLILGSTLLITVWKTDRPHGNTPQCQHLSERVTISSWAGQDDRETKRETSGKSGFERNQNGPRSLICDNAGVVGMGADGSSIAACCSPRATL